MKHRKHSNWQEQTLLLLATTWSYLNHLANIRPHACFGKASVAFSHLDLLCDKMTSSTKLEVRMVLHCHQRRTEPRPQVASTENFVKFGYAVFQICKWTDTLVTIHCTPPGGKVKINQC